MTAIACSPGADALGRCDVARFRMTTSMPAAGRAGQGPGRGGFPQGRGAGGARRPHPRLDVRTLCLAREILGCARWLADFAFAMQGLGTGSISLFGSPA